MIPSPELAAQIGLFLDDRRTAEAVSITPGSVTLADGRILECGSVVVCSGFTLFDARLKEEYGYPQAAVRSEYRRHRRLR